MQESVIWTDSISVLNYIKNMVMYSHTFLANSVTTLTEATKLFQLQYVCSKENPVDGASGRVRAGDFIQDSRKIGGPKFFCVDQRRTDMVETVTDKDDMKAKKAAMVNLSNDSSPDATSHHITHFLDWSELKVAVA